MDNWYKNALTGDVTKSNSSEEQEDKYFVILKEKLIKKLLAFAKRGKSEKCIKKESFMGSGTLAKSLF